MDIVSLYGQGSNEMEQASLAKMKRQLAFLVWLFPGLAESEHSIINTWCAIRFLETSSAILNNIIWLYEIKDSWKRGRKPI